MTVRETRRLVLGLILSSMCFATLVAVAEREEAKAAATFPAAGSSTADTVRACGVALDDFARARSGTKKAFESKLIDAGLARNLHTILVGSSNLLASEVCSRLLPPLIDMLPAHKHMYEEAIKYSKLRKQPLPKDPQRIPRRGSFVYPFLFTLLRSVWVKIFLRSLTDSGVISIYSSSFIISMAFSMSSL